MAFLLLVAGTGSILLAEGGLLLLTHNPPNSLSPSVTMSSPYGTDGNPGLFFTAKTTETLATIEEPCFFNNNAGYASLLETGNVLLVGASDGAKIYTLTVDRISREITLSSGLSIT